jgi:hypothetical protein
MRQDAEDMYVGSISIDVYKLHLSRTLDTNVGLVGGLGMDVLSNPPSSTTIDGDMIVASVSPVMPESAEVGDHDSVERKRLSAG